MNEELTKGVSSRVCITIGQCGTLYEHLFAVLFPMALSSVRLQGDLVQGDR